MLNNIKNAITAKLRAEFGETYSIYTEEAAQGMQVPCFFVQFVNPSQKRIRNNRYYSTNPLDIHYFPGTTNKNQEMNEVADRLYAALEYITVDGSLVRGSKMNHKLAEGTLHMFVEYNLFVLKITEGDPVMDTIKTNTTLN